MESLLLIQTSGLQKIWPKQSKLSNRYSLTGVEVV